MVEVKAITFENCKVLLRNGKGITKGCLVDIFILGIVFVVGVGYNAIGFGADENLIQNWSHGGPQ